MQTSKVPGFAAKLRELRERAGLTQQQLGEHAGIHKLTVAKLEQGIREPTWATVLELARALGVDCRAFDGGADAAPPVKRERGRPRKAEAAKVAKQQLARPRGRPRKAR